MYTPFAWVTEKGEHATHDFVSFAGDKSFLDYEDAEAFAFWMVQAVEWMVSRKAKA